MNTKIAAFVTYFIQLLDENKLETKDIHSIDYQNTITKKNCHHIAKRPRSREKLPKQTLPTSGN